MRVFKDNRGGGIVSVPLLRRVARAWGRRTLAVRCGSSAAAEEVSSLSAAGEVAIRRRPPRGAGSQPCGPVDFRVPLDEDNKPRNILEEIVWHKAVEIARWRERMPMAQLARVVKSAPPVRDFRGALVDAAKRVGRPGLIAEVKKASPSKGVIRADFDPVTIAQAYEAGGAACLSVLTDRKYFQGGFENLQTIREAGVQCPLLCKEFIVDAYQLMKARASGADAVLLIAAVLPNEDLGYFIRAARALGMACLVEVHTEAELVRVLQVPGIDEHVLGINNRDLGTFQVDLTVTTAIMASAAGQEVKQRGIPMIGESGIVTSEDVTTVQNAGCTGILVGESLVKQDDIAAAVQALLA